MMRSKFISALTAGSLLIASVAAGAQQPASIEGSRTSADVAEADELRGTMMIIGIIAVLLLIGGLVLLDGDDDPSSP